jgi:hypothetical protein
MNTYEHLGVVDRNCVELYHEVVERKHYLRLLRAIVAILPEYPTSTKISHGIGRNTAILNGRDNRMVDDIFRRLGIPPRKCKRPKQARLGNSALDEE